GLVLDGRKSDLISPPAGFVKVPPFNIYRDGSSYRTTFEPFQYKISNPEVRYYLSPTGSDSADGLTPSTARRSLKTLVDSITVLPTSAEFILEPGIYPNESNLNFPFPCNVVCPSGKAVLATIISTTWTKASGRENIWTAPTAASVRIVDLSNVDGDGFA